MTITEDVQKGLVAGAFGLAGTLIPAALAWSRERDNASARMRKLDEATRRVAFWNQWLRLSTKLADPADSGCIQRVQKEVEMLACILESDSLVIQAQLSAQQHKSTEFSHKVHAMSLWRRALLLYRPERSLAWFPRNLFYLGVVSVIFAFFLQLSDRTNWEGFAIIEFMGLIWIVIFRYLSRWLEHAHGTSLGLASAIPPPPRPS